MVNATSKSSRPTTEIEPVVYVIDDDPGMREALDLLFRSVGLRAQLFHHRERTHAE